MRMSQEQLVDRVMSNLDITPTMLVNAIQKYEAIAKYLSECGVDAGFYPQGSFRLGTVVRPYRAGKDASYDLDVVCQLQDDKEKVTPGNVKNSIGDCLKRSSLYSGKLLPECDRCWTLEYARVDDATGFMLDLVPAVRQDLTERVRLISLGVPNDKASHAIAITEKTSGGMYSWQHSNPAGYALWFDEINAPFADAVEQTQRQRIFESHRHVFASVEEIPRSLIRSPLQRVIQILKRHRDIFYYRAKAEDRKPISAIITTVCTQFARGTNPRVEVIELLRYMVDELYIYSELLRDEEQRRHSVLERRTFIRRDRQKWYIANPVDPSDNYADSWDERTAQLFFRWAQAVKEDLIDIDAYTDEMYRSVANALGEEAVRRAVPDIELSDSAIAATPTKPWRW
jgi:hypothetical protein